MILITQTDKKQYHAIEVPCHSRVIFGEHQNSYGDKSICYWDDVLKDSIYIRLNLKPESHFEIIGIQGGGDSLTEEQAIEVLYHNDLQAYEYDGSEALQFLKVVLKDLGIETENPYKKPEYLYYGGINFGMNGEEFWKWKEAESKLKKVVIIKSEI